MADPLPLKRIHHVELYAGNAKQAAYYYRKGMGFSQKSYLGPETGHRDRYSYHLQQGDVAFIVTSAGGPLSHINPWLTMHGDGVCDICFEVDDVDACFKAAVERGAKPAKEPYTEQDSNGRVRRAAIHTYGDVVHSFVSKADYNGPFLPGFQEQEIPEESVGLLAIDHIVGNVEEGNMDRWKDWYAQVMGFDQFVSFDDKDISTEFSALRSKVVASPDRAIKFPINEPALGKRKSQIQEYLDVNYAPGVQHVAVTTDDIVRTVGMMKERGIDFLNTPAAYYDDLLERVGNIDEAIDALKPLGILVDRDEHGYMLQLFTKPVQDRPTLFIEIIQRKGGQSFGKGNFKALFESIEREQARRGNL